SGKPALNFVEDVHSVPESGIMKLVQFRRFPRTSFAISRRFANAADGCIRPCAGPECRTNWRFALFHQTSPLHGQISCLSANKCRRERKSSARDTRRCETRWAE